MPEDPSRLLDHILCEMRMQLHEAKKQVCVAMVDERALRKQADRHASDAAAWERRAMMAVRAGDDGLARAALLRKGEQQDLATTYETQWRDQKHAVDNLRAALRALDDRIADASRQRTLLVARAHRAQAQRTIATTLGNLHGLSAWSPLERMEDRVTQLEADVEASIDLFGDDISLEAQFAALAARNDLDDQLAALKRRVESERPRKALPPSSL